MFFHIGYFLDHFIVFILRINGSSKYGINFCLCNSENTVLGKKTA